MVKITNGRDIFEVSLGAFNGVYKAQGFSIFENKEKVEPEEIEFEDEKSEDEIFCDELVEKPVGQWNKSEVKRFCEINGIDISGTKNPNEAKQIIKEFLD